MVIPTVLPPELPVVTTVSPTATLTDQTDGSITAPTATPTMTNTLVPTNTALPTITPTESPTETPTPTPPDTATPIPPDTATPLPTATPSPTATSTETPSPLSAYPAVQRFISDDGCRNLATWDKDASVSFEISDGFDVNDYAIRIYVWNNRHSAAPLVYVEPKNPAEDVQQDGNVVTIKFKGGDAHAVLSDGAYAQEPYNPRHHDSRWGVKFVVNGIESELYKDDQCRFKIDDALVGSGSQGDSGTNNNSRSTDGFRADK